MIFNLIFLLALSVATIFAASKLKTDVDPKSYEVNLYINTESKSKSFTGNVCIKMKCKGDVAVDIVNLHSKAEQGIKIPHKHSVTVELVPGRREKPQSIKVEDLQYVGDVLSVILTQPMDPGKTYKMCIGYEGQITENYGYFRWENSGKYVIATNFKRQSAFPCFDEPDMRATYTITIYTIPDSHMFCNDIANQMVRMHTAKSRSFNINTKLPPSQISFVVTNLDIQMSCNFFSSQFRACFFGNAKFSNGVKFNVEPFTKRMSVSYSLAPRLTMPTTQLIVIPTDKKLVSFNWALAAISESEVIGDNYDKRMLNFYHRLSSVIFGGLVSPDRWDSDWLYAALSEYMALVQMKKRPFLKEAVRVMWRRPNGCVYGNMEKGIDLFQTEINGANKGLMLVRMIHLYVGEESFITGIRKFINDYKNKSAAPNQLWKIFPEEARLLKTPQGVKWVTIMEKYTEQLSYPLVSVDMKEDGQFKVKQEPLVGSYKERINQRQSQSQNRNNDNCWIIPLPYTLYHIKQETAVPLNWDHWLDCKQNKEVTFTVDMGKYEVLFFNLNYYGMYRVKYDAKSWERIVESLKTSRKIIVNVRAQIVHDALALSWLGYQDYSYVFSLKPYLETEDDEFVWTVFFSAAYDLNEILLTSPDTYRLFQTFVNSIIDFSFTKKYTMFFDRLRQDSKFRVPYNDALFHHWACNVARNDNCREQAISTFDKWVAQPMSYPKTDEDVKNRIFLFSIVLCTVLNEKENYDEQWLKKVSFITDKLFKDQDLIFANSYYYALRCITDEKSIESVLKWASSPATDAIPIERKQQSFLALAKGKDSFETTLKYFYEHYDDKIKVNHGSDEFMAKFMMVLTTRMDPKEVVEMENFIARKTDLKKEVVEQSFAKGKSRAALRYEWLKENGSNIQSLLA